MLYLNKFLNGIKENPGIFKTMNIVETLGLSSTQIKDLKRFALESQLIVKNKQDYFLTENGENYLNLKPIQSWKTKEFSLRPEINTELLKEEKAQAILTKAIRALAKNLIENQPLKENSLEASLDKDLRKCEKLIQIFEMNLLDGKRNVLEGIYLKYSSLGLTKSLISIILLQVLCKNIQKLAIYEKSQFQLKFDSLMFDRIIACPQNFEVQKTEMKDQYILKDVSKIILNEKSENILEITKGLIKIFKEYDKYTTNTQNLTPNTIKFRNVVLNAKDPISLFKKDIPKSLSGKELQDCDREFINNLKQSLMELKRCSLNLTKELRSFFLESFQDSSKENLAERFFKIKEFLNEKELKILFNNIIDINVDDNLWIQRIATYINKYRVPKDWNDEDLADFKLKTKELAFKIFTIEAIAGMNECLLSESVSKIHTKFNSLSKPEKISFIRKSIQNLE